MFKIEKSATFKWPIKYQGVDEKGAVITEEFTVEFKRKEQAYIDSLIENDTPSILVSKEVICGWDGVCDAEGNAIPFSEDIKERLLQAPGMAQLIALEFVNAMRGGALRKN